VGCAEAHDDAAVPAEFRVARLLVVGADENLVAGDDGTAVRRVPELGGPLDILLLAFLDAPVGEDTLGEGVGPVAAGPAAEHRPRFGPSCGVFLAGAGGGRTGAGGAQEQGGKHPQGRQPAVRAETAVHPSGSSSLSPLAP